MLGIKWRSNAPSVLQARGLSLLYMSPTILYITHLPLNPIGVLFLLTASIPAPRTGYTHYRDGRAPGYLREKERDGREGKRPSVFVIEERFRVLGPVQHLIINAGYVEHQPHHQGQTWGETKEKDGGKRFGDEVAEKLPSFRTLLAGESVKLWKCA